MKVYGFEIPHMEGHIECDTSPYGFIRYITLRRLLDSILGFGPKFLCQAIFAKQEVESSAFVRRLGRQGCQTFAIGLALQTALCRSAWQYKKIATVRHVGGAKQYIPQNRHDCHPEAPPVGVETHW